MFLNTGQAVFRIDWRNGSHLVDGAFHLAGNALLREAFGRGA
jgi:hypothetical protein